MSDQLAYPPELEALVKRLRFSFRHQGRVVGLTSDIELVREFAELGIRALPYKRAPGSTHDDYEVYLPRAEETVQT